MRRALAGTSIVPAALARARGSRAGAPGARHNPRPPASPPPAPLRPLPAQYRGPKHYNGVDADMVPVPHFGVCMTVPAFHALADKLSAAGTAFVLKPHLRFSGKPGEQWTMFLEDPSGNSLEFKALTNPDNLFAKYYVDE